MIKNISLFLLSLTIIFPMMLTAQFSKEIDLKKENYFKAIDAADNVFQAIYLRGGKTKAKVRIVKNIIGTVSEEVIITGLDDEKLRRKYKMRPLKPKHEYIFFAKKEGGVLVVHPEAVTIEVKKNKASFSLVTPYMPNFWQPADINALYAAIKAIKEKTSGIVSTSLRKKIKTLFTEYLKVKDEASLKLLLAAARFSKLKFPEEQYNELLNMGGMLGCIAVRYSAGIMGEMYFQKKVLKNINNFTQDQKIALAKAAVDADSKDSISYIAKILQTGNTFRPASSECFPISKPETNRETFIRTIIEIDGPQTVSLISREMKSEDTAWLASILKIISEYEGADLIKIVLNAAINERYSERKIEYANYFQRIKSKNVAKVLISIYDKKDEAQWKKIILATIGKYGYKKALPFLIKALEGEPLEEVRTTAAMAIGALNNKEGVKPLYNFIMREKSILAKTIAIDAMALIESKAVQDYLKKIIKKDESAKVREEAADAIEDNLFILRYGRKKK